MIDVLDKSVYRDDDNANDHLSWVVKYRLEESLENVITLQKLELLNRSIEFWNQHLAFVNSSECKVSKIVKQKTSTYCRLKLKKLKLELHCCEIRLDLLDSNQK